MIKCKECGIQFNEKDPMHARHGYINQCMKCGAQVDDVKRHIGRQSEGRGCIEIFRENHVFVENVIDEEVQGGYYPNISVSSPIIPLKILKVLSKI